MNDWLKNECYCSIVKISSLTIFHQIQLTEIESVRFNNYRYLYSIGDSNDHLRVFLQLRELEESIKGRIAKF